MRHQKRQYDPQDKFRKRKKRIWLKAKYDEIKMSNFCQRCRWEDYRYPYVLDFDHQYNKEKCVSNMLSSVMNWDKIFEEIKKCQILCSNCHRIKTKEDRDNNITHEVIEKNQGELF